MVYYWILLGGNGIGAIVFAYVHCTLPPFLATHTVAQPPILKHDIHNQKPTYHCIATNFRAWDPLPKTKSPTQIHKIQNHKYKFRPTKIHKQNLHFLISAFKISNNQHKSQSIHHQDLSWKWKRGDELYLIDFEIMDSTMSSWSWPYKFWVMIKTKPKSDPAPIDTNFISADLCGSMHGETQNTKLWVRGKDWDRRSMKRLLGLWNWRRAFGSFDLVTLKQ